MSVELILPEPIGLQPQWLASSASKKVLRVGRRGTKTRFAMLAAIVGHGDGPDDNKQFPGILAGWDVVWIAQDFPNLLRVVWKEEIKPRFGHLPWATLNGQDHVCMIHGLGTLHFGSAEAINGIRGMGKRVKGVIVDEAAWLNLEEALLDVILPVLLDNDGWLIIMSTTNAGPDGNVEKIVPSYFNRICEQIRAGERTQDWEEFTGTAYDNPTISKEAIDALIQEYPPNSPKLKQEVFAELLVAGVGLALPDLDERVHLVPRYPIPAHWTQFGGFDWGYNHPWVFGWYACDDDGNIVKLETVWGRGQQPEQIGATVNAVIPMKQLRSVHSGTDIFFRKGQAVGFQGPTIAERLIKDFKWRLVQADTRAGSREKGLDNLRNYTYHDRATETELARPPRLTFMDTEGNRRCFHQLQQMQLDPKHVEDALKVDANAAGLGGDDSYDETRYALMSRPAKARLPNDKLTDHKQPNKAAPLIVKDGKLVKPDKPPQTIEELVDWAARRQNGSGRLPHIQRSPTRR